MQYRLSTLLWIVLGIAVAICVCRSMPMLTLSCILLVPLPLLVAHWFSSRNSTSSILLRRPRTWACVLCLACVLFYIGMTGPLFAIFCLPDHFPLLAKSSRLKSCVDMLYTPLSWLENDSGDSHLLLQYQYWWLRLTMVVIEAPE
ncbi:hypothetical protein Pla52n_67330 [Stieleria varia]|uniref:Uncharacterized protein n=1 Tax=Stieleria varia TaxID=2528005 RepID=A0A5C5ZRA6_9BACT|nr:hypothetical protein Pla52n_67330 [Stieleria varia]